MRAELEARCPDGRFLGTLTHDRMAVTMASADVLLFPSATDSLGNVVLEAQAAGLPVIVSDRGGPHQHMVHESTGLVCAAGDAPAFTSALVTLLRQPVLRAEISRHARDYARTRDWPASLAPLFDTWRTAVRSRDAANDPAVRDPRRRRALREEILR